MLTRAVLVVLRNRILLRFGRLQGLCLHLPPSNYRETSTYLDPLFGHAPHRYNRPGLHVHHVAAVQTARVFLDAHRPRSIHRGLVHEYPDCHCHDLCV